MAKKDIHNNIEPVVAVNIQSISSNTTVTGNEINLAGYEGCEFIFVTGTVTDGDYTIEITECDTSGGVFTAVADADLLGTEANTSTVDNTDDNKYGKIGYIGGKQYVKATITSTNVTTGATVGMVALKGFPLVAPVTYTAP
jgi:hypothetical protein